MDGALPRTLQEETNCKSCFSESLNTIAWSDRTLHLDTSSRLPSSQKTALVGQNPPRAPTRAYTVSRYIPPHLDKEKSNVQNSQNTALFLTSVFEYILSGIILSVGPPFRQSMAHNRKSFLDVYDKRVFTKSAQYLLL